MLRTKLGKDIVAEFLPPARATKKQRVIILCSGAPSVPSKKTLMEFLSKKGFWVIFPRYRGSWESGGVFLKDSPHLDVLEVIKQLPKGFTDVWNNKKYKVNPNEVIVLAASFGGPAGMLASKDKNIDKVVAISSVIDWTDLGPDEPYPKSIRYFDQAFGQGYRFHKDGWNKLKSGKFYNPIKQLDKIDSSKILLIHARDDQTCLYRSTKKFAELTNTKLVTLPRGDHLGTSLILTPRFYKIFKKFIDQKP